MLASASDGDYGTGQLSIRFIIQYLTNIHTVIVPKHGIVKILNGLKLLISFDVGPTAL